MSFDNTRQYQQCENSCRHDQSVMLGISADRSSQYPAEVLCRTSHANKCRIDDEAVDFPKEIGHAKHRLPNHRLIDLSNETVLETRQRPSGQFRKQCRTPSIEPVRIQADRRHRIEMFEK